MVRVVGVFDSFPCFSRRSVIMDHAVGVRSAESLQHLLGDFFKGRYCDIGVWHRPGDGVMSVVEAASDDADADAEWCWLEEGMSMDAMCVALADEPKFVVVTAPLWKSQWGRILMRVLSETTPVKRFELKGKVFALRTKVLFLFPMEVEGDTASGPDDLEAVADKLLCVVYDPR